MDILAQIVAHKKNEVAAAVKQLSLSTLRDQALAADRRRPFSDALKHPGPAGVNIIAEIKRASPSKGILNENLNAAQTAQAYHAGGAAALSVLTDRRFFNGAPADLQHARAATPLPVLRKDFLIDTYQIYESVVLGADAVLLICRILSPGQFNELLALCRELNLDTLVEIHTREDLAMAREARASLVGINNRNLQTFETNLDTAMGLARGLGAGQVPVAASGIRGPLDIQRNLKAGIYNFLIGETLVRAADPTSALQAMIQTGAGALSSMNRPPTRAGKA